MSEDDERRHLLWRFHSRQAGSREHTRYHLLYPSLARTKKKQACFLHLIHPSLPLLEQQPTITITTHVKNLSNVLLSQGDAAAEVATGSSGHALGVSGGGDAGMSVGEARGVGDGGGAGGSATGAASESAGGNAKPAKVKANAKPGGAAGAADDAQMQEIQRLRRHTESLERCH